MQRIRGLNSHIAVGIDAIDAESKAFDSVFALNGGPVTTRWDVMSVWFGYHPECEPWGVLIYNQEVPVAAAVLSRRRRAGIWWISKPGEADHQARLAAVSEDAALALAESIADTIEGFGGPWTFSFPGLRNSNRVVAHLLSIWRHSERREGVPVPYLACGPADSLQSRVSRNTRNVVAKARNRIERESIALREQWTIEPEAIISRLPEIVRINRERNRQLRRRSPLDDPLAKSYYIDFLTAVVRYGRAELFTLELDDDLAAFAMCSRDAGECWVLANLASPRWLRYSPGTIANTEVVLHALDDPECLGVNWGMGVQRYKLSGGATLLPRQDILAWSSPALQFLSQLHSTCAAVRWRKRPFPSSSRVAASASSHGGQRRAARLRFSRWSRSGGQAGSPDAVRNGG